MKPKLLANENFPAPSVGYLRNCGFDVLCIAEDAVSLNDRDVLALAVAERRWILTFDRDYGELIFMRGLMAPPAVVLFRMKSYRPEEPGRVFVGLLDTKTEFEGHFVVIDQMELRKRRLPEMKRI